MLEAFQQFVLCCILFNRHRSTNKEDDIEASKPAFLYTNTNILKPCWWRFLTTLAYLTLFTWHYSNR